MLYKNNYNIGTLSGKTVNTSTNYRIYSYVGGITGTGGTVENCYSYCELSSYASYNTSYYSYTPQQNGYGYAGYIKGTPDETVTNCYGLTTTIRGTNGTTVDEEKFQNGEVAYLLNNSESGGTTWYQNVDMGTEDNLPILDDTHYRVYKLSNDSYSNSPEDVMTGLCGGGRGNTNQNYTIDLANNNLTILGSGTMKDYSSDSPAPWQEYSQYIEYVDIAPSAQIDAEAFDGCDKIKVLYCYEGSPAETFFADNSAVTKKYVLDDTAVQLSGFDTTSQAFTISVNTNEFGGTGAKYLEGVKVIVNNGESSEYVTNYQEDANDSGYANFAVQLDGTLNSYTDIRAEVLAKDSAADDSITYYVSEPYSNLSTEV